VEDRREKGEDRIGHTEGKRWICDGPGSARSVWCDFEIDNLGSLGY